MPSERLQRRIDRLLDQAEEAGDRRDWSEVQVLAREVVLLDESNADAASLLRVAEGMLMEAEAPSGSDARAASDTVAPPVSADISTAVSRVEQAYAISSPAATTGPSERTGPRRKPTTSRQASRTSTCESGSR